MQSPWHGRIYTRLLDIKLPLKIAPSGRLLGLHIVEIIASNADAVSRTSPLPSLMDHNTVLEAVMRVRMQTCAHGL